MVRPRGGRAVLISAAALATHCCSDAKDAMELYHLSDPLAVCGDGTRAGYYLQIPEQAGNDSATNRTWIVDLEGGGWCHDEKSCNQRCPFASTKHLCSSKEWPTSISHDGLLDSHDGGTLEKAYKVFVPYCTSDGHMGDTTTFNGRHFRGARVVRRVIDTLINEHGLGFVQSEGARDLVILGGQSAGGRGAMVNLDSVAELLHKAPGNVETVGFLDSPLWLDIDPFGPGNFDGFPSQCKSVFSYANVTNVGEECGKTWKGADAWKCILGQYRIPTLKTPYFLVASQYDSFQLGLNAIHPWNVKLNSKKRKYGTRFAGKTSDLVKSIRSSWPEDRPRTNAVYSWSCYNHATSLSSSGFDGDSTGDGVTVTQAFHQWLEQSVTNKSSSAFEWVESCKGFACGRDCQRTWRARWPWPFSWRHQGPEARYLPTYLGASRASLLSLSPDDVVSEYSTVLV